ncbi:uncharacterized protein [Setaria viridis]|uniref:uncharacterized protein n=1 Tax=Setaria viridis TaxID=4556 RepID=UPI003B3A6E68
MNIDMNTLDPADIPLLGFGGKPVKALGKIALPVSFGDRDNARTEHITFDVVEMQYPYNAILGRGFITKMDATIRKPYLCMKIPAHKGVITVFGDQQMARNIEKGVAPGQKNVHHLASANEAKSSAKQKTHNEPKRDKEKIKISADGETKRVLLDGYIADRFVTIGANLDPEEERNLIEGLNKNKDIFAWSASDLKGVDREIIEHSLDIRQGARPKKQKLRKMSDEKVQAVKAEVDRLLEANIIKPIQYPDWLANTVPVKKKNGKWRMCIDFTDLNKACPKDDYPLERIDKVVDDATNSEMLSLLDLFSGYHQIKIKKEDEGKTSFVTPFGTFCFVCMPEGLKNAGQTFSRMTVIVLDSQLRRNILAY